MLQAGESCLLRRRQVDRRKSVIAEAVEELRRRGSERAGPGEMERVPQARFFLHGAERVGAGGSCGDEAWRGWGNGLDRDALCSTMLRRPVPGLHPKGQMMGESHWAELELRKTPTDN
jgi:hypothetical protein